MAEDSTHRVLAEGQEQVHGRRVVVVKRVSRHCVRAISRMKEALSLEICREGTDTTPLGRVAGEHRAQQRAGVVARLT
jgi:hypothetical protein